MYCPNCGNDKFLNSYKVVCETCNNVITNIQRIHDALQLMNDLEKLANNGVNRPFIKGHLKNMKSYDPNNR